MDNTTKDISFKAIIIGFLADIGGTFAFGFVFGLLATMMLVSSGEDPTQLLEFSKTTAFKIVMPIAGLLFTAFGGYVTARIAKRAELKNALFMGLASAIFGLISMVLSFETSSPLTDVPAIFLTVLAALAGGYLHMKTREAEKAHGEGRR